MANVSMAKAQGSRYKVIERVGSGEFARVYSADDTKLGRKVAIKQLRSQYLEDEEKLDRYWDEAKLLVELEHPNIVTIYDVVKRKGCLVLELMKGSLKQVYGDKPMPVSDVRETIIEAARGLECLHKAGIIHGDIKPANMMLSRQNVVKLGDFGLARRASDAEGSLVKGTTKYMAPELVSEEFGDVGPQSDLYSLGFSALELLVGPDFDSLFPDLIAFGRDPQMAWMMWHCSKDRRFPPIQSTLAGVPDDLAHVLNKLTEKDQSKRYQSAREVILDLKSGAKPVGESITEEEARQAELARKKKQKQRIIAAVCCMMSLVATGLILWLTREKPAPVVKQPPPPFRGTLRNVLDRDDKFVVDPGSGDFREYQLFPGDKVILNRKERQLRDLQLGDLIEVRTTLEGELQEIKRREVLAFRPEQHSGRVSEVDLEKGTIKIQVREGEEDGQQFDLKVLETTEISLNEYSGEEDQPLTLQSLAAEDQVEVKLSDDTSGMVALKIDATRTMGFSGVIRKLSPKNGTITIADNSSGAEQLIELMLSPECRFQLNDVSSIDDRLLNVTDIKVGDRVDVKHDVKITSIEAYRPFEDIGRIQTVEYDLNQFTLKSQSATGSKTYRIDNKTQILLGNEPVEIDALRMNDDAQLVHDMPDAEIPTILSLNVTRPIVRNRWAILIANETFDSPEIDNLPSTISNLESLRSNLSNRFGVPESQIKVFEDEARVRLEQELPRIISRLSSSSELYIYVAGRGFAEPGKNAYLGTRNVDPEELATTALPLDWLIDLLDNSKAAKKVLLLDCDASQTTGDAVASTSKGLVELLQSVRRGGYPRFTYVLANASENQNFNASTEFPGRSIFGQAVIEAFEGKADKERDTKIEITELTKYITARTEDIASNQNLNQLPLLFVPDARPPRLSDKDQKDIIELLSDISDPKLTDEVVGRALQISRQTKGQPEPILAAGFALMKRGRIPDALTMLEENRLKNKSSLLSHQAVIWIHFYKRDYKTGAAKLADMIQAIPVPEDNGELAEYELAKLQWAGRLRALAGNSASWNQRVPDEATLQRCDDLVARFGQTAIDRFNTGRTAVRAIVKRFDAEVEEDPNSKAALDRKKINSYLPQIHSVESVQEIQAGLDK